MHNSIRTLSNMYCLLISRLHYYAYAYRMSILYYAYIDNLLCSVWPCRDVPLQKGFTYEKVYAVEDSEPDGLLLPRFGHVHDHDRRVGDAIGDMCRSTEIHEGTRRRFISKG